MYEPKSHALLNDILRELQSEMEGHDLYYFYIRIGANFYAIYSLFKRLYGQRQDFQAQLYNLVKALAWNYINRSQRLRSKDLMRERHYDWFMDQKWTGMALYTSGFAENLSGVTKRISYFEELGINLIHLMPILKCPVDRSDGGYAVSNFRQIDPRAGTMEELEVLADELGKRDMLLVLDVVVNHTSNEHEWARRARAGEQKYQDYYYLFEDRSVPDQFEKSMLEVFPTSAPGNFTWDDTLQRWVMTVFNTYQWDLNYRNPAVFIEMIDVILFWANKGVDIVRLDAVAFLWKKIGTTCQNEEEAHLLLQLMKDCCQVAAPGVLFIAEAIVAPVEINKYFGEDAVIAKECEIAYNATLMALLWDGIATRNCRLLKQGISSLPVKLEGATWLNYVRCHDDIGLGFADEDVVLAGYDPALHRRFLIDFFTGRFSGSPARGMPFAENEKTGDARISGSLASLAGLESAMDAGDVHAVDLAVNRILLLHSLILAFGGIPLVYYGDELGHRNFYSHLENPSLSDDNRWIHRPNIDWQMAERRHSEGTVEYRIFHGLRHLIETRKKLRAFADYNNRYLLATDNDHVFGFLRQHPESPTHNVLVLANFAESTQYVDLAILEGAGFAWPEQVADQISGRIPTIQAGRLAVEPLQTQWLMST